MSRQKLPDLLNRKDSVLDGLKNIELKPLAAEQPPSAAAVTVVPPATTDQTVAKNPTVKELTEAPEAGLSPTGTEIKSLQKPRATKVKYSIYLNPATKRQLERIQIELRDIIPPGLAGQINYSLIVETALEIAFEEFKRTRTNSSLSREVVNQLSERKS